VTTTARLWRGRTGRAGERRDEERTSGIVMQRHAAGAGAHP
jgi:hypothetical protein